MQITDNITYSRGHHTFRAGADLRWVRFAVLEIETPSDDYGLFTFNQNVFTGNAFGDLLLGLRLRPSCFSTHSGGRGSGIRSTCEVCYIGRR